MSHHSALRCVSGIRQNNAKPLISNGLRFVVTCLLTAALWVLFHTSRHTFAVLALAAGGDIYTVGKLLGHTSINSTQVYADVVMETVVEAINRFSYFLSENHSSASLRLVPAK